MVMRKRGAAVVMLSKLRQSGGLVFPRVQHAGLASKGRVGFLQICGPVYYDKERRGSCRLCWVGMGGIRSVLTGASGYKKMLLGMTQWCSITEV